MTVFMDAFMGLYFGGQDEAKEAWRQTATTVAAQTMFAREMEAFAARLALFELLAQLEGAA